MIQSCEMPEKQLKLFLFSPDFIGYSQKNRPKIPKHHSTEKVKKETQKTAVKG